jgi:hypothetical protein
MRHGLEMEYSSNVDQDGKNLLIHRKREIWSQSKRILGLIFMLCSFVLSVWGGRALRVERSSIC